MNTIPQAFKLSPEMEQELHHDIASLAAQTDETSFDAAGSVFNPARIRRRPVDLLSSEGDEAGRSDNQAVPREEAVSAEASIEDPINPSHYRKHPSGIECIEITRHLNFNVGNAIKYIWRYQDKGDPVENLKKAQWYLDDEIRRLQGQR